MASLLMDPFGYRGLDLDDGWSTHEYSDWVARLASRLGAPGGRRSGR